MVFIPRVTEAYRFQLFRLSVRPPVCPRFLYAPYLRHSSSKCSQTSQKENTYSGVVQRKVVFRFVNKIVKIMSISLIFYLRFLYASYLRHHLSEFSQTLQKENTYSEVVRCQVIFRFVKNC